MEDVDRVVKAVSCESGIILFRPNRTSVWHDKQMSDRILINQIQMNTLDLSKAVLS
jgi:hypothetical protein